jgi:hypothetical protein
VTPEEFANELQRIESMAFAQNVDAIYWSGFKRGLLRAYHGQRFSSNTDHYAWLDFPHDRDPVVAALGRGYRDGLEAVISGKRAEACVVAPASLVAASPAAC